MAISDNELLRELITGGMDKRAAMALLTRLNAASRAWSAGGNRTVILGNSIDLGSDTPTARGESCYTYAGIASAQRFLVVSNSSVIGNTTAQMLARFDTAVTPYKPTTVVLGGAENDVTTGVAIATWQANVESFVAKCHAIGAEPVLRTNAPSDTSPDTQTMATWNRWIKAYGQANGLQVLDFYTILVDPTNGHYLAAYHSDGVHPNSAGFAALGAMINSSFVPSLPVFTPPIPTWRTDTDNALHVMNPLFTDTTLGPDTEPNADGPIFWNVLNPAQRVGSIVTADPTIKGNWYKQTFATSTLDSQVYENALPFTGHDGHKVAFTGNIKSTLSAGSFVFDVAFSDGVSDNLILYIGNLSQPVTGRWWITGIVPAGTQYLNEAYLTKAGAVGDVQIGQLGVLCLTHLGIDGLF